MDTPNEDALKLVAQYVGWEFARNPELGNDVFRVEKIGGYPTLVWTLDLSEGDRFDVVCDLSYFTPGPSVLDDMYRLGRLFVKAAVASARRSRHRVYLRERLAEVAEAAITKSRLVGVKLVGVTVHPVSVYSTKLPVGMDLRFEYEVGGETVGVALTNICGVQELAGRFQGILVRIDAHRNPERGEAAGRRIEELKAKWAKLDAARAEAAMTAARRSG